MRVHDIHFEGVPPFKMEFDPNFYADWALLSFLSSSRAPEPEVYQAIVRIVRPGDVVIDAGANIGFYSVMMAKIVGAEGHVIAFEPVPENMRHVRRNAEVNGLTNIATYEQGLSSRLAETDFYVNADTGQSALWSCVDTRETIRINVMPLDAIASALPDGVRFMKLDVEGAEEIVMQGASALLKNGFPTFIVAELNPVALTQLDCHQDSMRSFMSVWGYQTFILREDGSLPAMVPERTVIKPKKSNTNIMFARLNDVQAVWSETTA
jgi:FkbM family methyltransferase